MACPEATALSDTVVEAMVASPALVAVRFGSVRTVEPGAAHVPSTTATEWDEFASNPVSVAVSVAFGPEISVIVAVPEGPKDPVGVTCTVRVPEVGPVESLHAAV